MYYSEQRMTIYLTDLGRNICCMPQLYKEILKSLIIYKPKAGNYALIPIIHQNKVVRYLYYKLIACCLRATGMMLASSVLTSSGQLKIFFHVLPTGFFPFPKDVQLLLLCQSKDFIMQETHSNLSFMYLCLSSQIYVGNFSGKRWPGVLFI